MVGAPKFNGSDVLIHTNAERPYGATHVLFITWASNKVDDKSGGARGKVLHGVSNRGN